MSGTRRSGGKAKPTALKLLQGNPGKRPLNEAEPKPEPEIPSCPEHLDEEAQREWERMAGRLSDLGLLTGIDRAALAAYCLAWSRWVQAEEAVRETGLLLQSAKTMVFYQNPMVAIANRAQAEMRRWIQEFGMTPSSRSGMKVTESNEKKNPLAKYLKSGS